MSDFERRIADLSPAKQELMRQIASKQQRKQNTIKPQARPTRIPLTFGQRRLWLLDQFMPGMSAYNSPCGLWLRGSINRAAMQNAAQALLDRHEVLRTVYRSNNGQPHQVILENITLPWCELVAEGTSLEERRKAALKLARVQTAQAFDLSRDSMLRTALIQVTPELHLLIITFHHIAIDGWSISTLLNELQKCYNEFCLGNRPNLLGPELQIADIALWQNENLTDEKLKPQLDYWRQHLEGAVPTMDLPSDRPRPAIQSFQGALWKTEVPKNLYQRLDQLASEQQVTLSMLFLAAFQAVLTRYTHQEDIVVAMGVVGRARMELEPVVGFFVNTLAIRTRIDSNTKFTDLLGSVRESVFGAMENADAPLDRVLDQLKLVRSASHTPLAQVLFFFQNYPMQNIQLSGLAIENVHLSDIAPNSAQGELSLFVNQHAERELMFEYSTDLFDEISIQRLAGHLITFLNAAVDNPQTPVITMPMLSTAEHDELTHWNDTQRQLPEQKTLSTLIEAQVVRTPDATALSFQGRAVSYRELDQRANALAHELRAAGVVAGALVGLYVERSIEMLIGLLGILKAGGAYVPLDPTYPADRLAYMLEASAANVIVTQLELVDMLPMKVDKVIIANACAILTDTISQAPPNGAGPDDLAYVIFTSGSTGKPKGVEISQKSAVNLLRSVAREPGLTASDSLCAISTLSFDIALFELILPLTVGAKILLVDRDTARDGLSLRRFVDETNITVMQATPATWRMLLEVGWRGKSGLKMISTGEALPRELADRLLPCCRELWNLYGPTETTVYSALCQVTAGEGAILVGKPVDNTQIHIVDKHMQIMPPGVPGELLIGGEGLARGYRGRPDLTAEKFIPNPFSKNSNALLYRTGDLALWRRDGTIEVIGRIDHQVKLRGFRIELGEIEAVLAQHPHITQAVVHCREDRPGDKRLVAYVTHDSPALSVTQLRDHLKASLPDYMVPSAFVILKNFPLTPNGKVDRNALPMPGQIDNEEETDDLANRSDEEKNLGKLWATLLNVRHVKRSDNFFDLGGHSLLATQLLSRIAQEYDVQLSLRTLFEFPTLEQLSLKLAETIADTETDDMEALLQKLEHLSEQEASDLMADKNPTISGNRHE
jgi:amino acid adenylation domain-containing protein